MIYRLKTVQNNTVQLDWPVQPIKLTFSLKKTCWLLKHWNGVGTGPKVWSPQSIRNTLVWLCMTLGPSNGKSKSDLVTRALWMFKNFLGVKENLTSTIRTSLTDLWPDSSSEKVSRPFRTNTAWNWLALLLVGINSQSTREPLTLTH